MATVLLIEDNEDDREVYRALLYYNGFEVIVAEDGRAGIALAAERLPDVILIDVMLPGMSGLAAAQLVHTNPATTHIPIICMSAYDVDVNLVLHSGARELLAKPVSGDTLVLAIRKYIGWEDSPAAPPAEGQSA